MASATASGPSPLGQVRRVLLGKVCCLLKLVYVVDYTLVPLVLHFHVEVGLYLQLWDLGRRLEGLVHGVDDFVKNHLLLELVDTHAGFGRVFDVARRVPE